MVCGDGFIVVNVYLIWVLWWIDFVFIVFGSFVNVLVCCNVVGIYDVMMDVGGMIYY